MLHLNVGIEGGPDDMGMDIRISDVGTANTLLIRPVPYAYAQEHGPNRRTVNREIQVFSLRNRAAFDVIERPPRDYCVSRRHDTGQGIVQLLLVLRNDNRLATNW
jgi:hypothetical protein